jgi:hypothetical protein
MALVGDIQLQDSAVKPPALDTSKKFSAEGLTATTAFAVTDAGAGNTVSTTGLITAKSSNDISGWIQTTKADGNVSLYLSNDARPDWALKVSGSASDAFVIANSTGANDTCQYPALSIGTAGAVGIGKYGASNALDISYQNSSSGGVVITEATNSVATKIISLATCSVMGTSTNHKLGFITNDTTVGMFDTSGNFGIGTEAPGAVLDVRGAAIFNEAGAAVDFRIEGDTEANLFFVDGSTDRIGIGTATPAVELDVDFGGDGTGVLMCVNGCICAAGYMGEKQGHTIEDSGVAETQRTGLNFVVTDVGCVVDDSSNDATVVCINGANTCVPFLMCDGSTSDPISLAGGSIGNQLANDGTPCLGGTLNGCDENVCCICCLAIKGCYFGDGSQLTGVSSVPSSFSGDCTIIGCDAGGNVAGGGAKIVLIGGNAGYNATTPSNIVVMGSSAALCMTTATDTVLIGTGAGRCVLTCAGNLALGAWSLYNECAGTYNTALGTCAGLTQKGATTNTFVGAYAGTAVTTGSANVFLGYKAGCAETTGACCLIIGNGTCDLITGDFNGGSLQIDGSLVNCGTLTVGVNDTGHDVKFFGASSGAFMLYDESADTLDVRGATAAGPGVLKLTTGELTNVDGGILGRLEFQAPLDSAGTDAILVAASIWGEANGTFAAACNKTDLVFATADSETAAEKMRITSAGYVGVGTASPAYLLEAVGTAAALKLLVSDAAAVTYTSNTIGAFQNTSAGTGAISRVAIVGGTAGYSVLDFGDSGASNAGGFTYNHSTNALAIATGGSGATMMTIDSGGHVGIGTTPVAWSTLSPALQIGTRTSFADQSDAASYMLYNAYHNGSNFIGIDDVVSMWFYMNSSGFTLNTAAANGAGGTLTPSELLTVDTDGCVGIGTTDPKGTLHILDTSVGGGKAGNWIIGTGGSTTGCEYVEFGYDIDNDNGWKLSNWNEGTEDVVMRSYIGTSKLTVGGDVAADGTLHVFSATAGSVTANANEDDLVIENSGNAGISILTPNSAAGSIAFGDPDDNDKAMIQYNHSNDKFFIYMDSASQYGVTIDNAGAVAVGTATTCGALHMVEGTKNCSVATFTGCSASGTSSASAKLYAGVISSIADNGIADITDSLATGNGAGTWEIHVSNNMGGGGSASYYAMGSFRTTDNRGGAVITSHGATFQAYSTDLTGTTGGDGQFNIGFVSGGTIVLENRLGFTVSVMYRVWTY